MKKIFFVFAFILFALTSRAQMSRADVETYMTACELSYGELTIWNTYTLTPNDTSLKSRSFLLSKCTYKYGETAMTIYYEKSIVLVPYSAIKYMIFLKNGTREDLHISLKD